MVPGMASRHPELSQKHLIRFNLLTQMPHCDLSQKAEKRYLSLPPTRQDLIQGQKPEGQ